MKKSIVFFLVLTLSIMCCVFAACGDPAEGDIVAGNDETVYTYEAEDTDVSGLSSPVFSGEASGYKMVMGANTVSIRDNKKVLNSISNQYFVSYVNAAGITLEFNVNSDSASTGNSIALRLASEWGTLKVNPTNIEVRVNGTAQQYEEFTVPGERLSTNGDKSAYKTPFRDFTLSDEINLVKGSNTIEIEILNTNYGLTELSKYGPGVDAIKIVSKSTLTWEKLFEENKGNIVEN